MKSRREDRRRVGRPGQRAGSRPLRPEQAAELVPLWRGAGILTLEPMLGGRSNTSYRVQVDGKTFVLRLNAVNGPLLGLDHEREFEILKHVGAADLGPLPVYVDIEQGVLVTRYLEGATCSADFVRKPENIERIVRALKKLHRLPAPKHRLDLAFVVNRYCKTIVGKGPHYAGELEEMRTRLLGLVRTWAQGSEQVCLCHNDLFHNNIIDGQGIQFIDWEYAATGDPMFELAALSQYHQYTEHHTEYLLEQYFGEVTETLQQRMRRTPAVFDAVSILWVLAFRASAGGSVHPEAGSEGLLLEHLARLADGGSPLRGWG